MKVLQVNSVCGKGSTGRIATDIYDILKENGDACKILYGRDEALKIPKEDTIQVGNPWTVRFHALLSRLTGRHGFFSKGATKRAIEKIKQFNPDVIHLHNIHGYWVHIEELFRYLKESKKPVVWTLHDCWSFTGHCAYFSYAGCEKWKKGCENCPQLGNYPKSFWDNSRWNYQKKKEMFTSLENLTLVTPSKWLAGLVKASFLKKYPVTVIPNGIDLDVFRPTEGDFRARYGLEGKQILLGVASVWEKRKGLADLIALADFLIEEQRLVIVGVTEEQKNQLPTGVIGISKTASVQELVEIYSAADCLLNPTYEDNFPTVNMEALACGTPVVTYQTGGSVESIDETCGVVVPQGDIKRLYQEATTCAFVQEDCRKKAETFEKKEQFKKYLEIYREAKR